MIIDKEKCKKATIVGTVLSAKMDKTLVVGVVRTVRHAQFHKILKKTKKYYVHDADSIAQKGDLVEMFETRPLSKLKRMCLLRVISSTSNN